MSADGKEFGHPAVSTRYRFSSTDVKVDYHANEIIPEILSIPQIPCNCRLLGLCFSYFILGTT